MAQSTRGGKSIEKGMGGIGHFSGW